MNVIHFLLKYLECIYLIDRKDPFRQLAEENTRSISLRKPEKANNYCVNLQKGSGNLILLKHTMSKTNKNSNMPRIY